MLWRLLWGPPIWGNYHLVVRRSMTADAWPARSRKSLFARMAGPMPQRQLLQGLPQCRWLGPRRIIRVVCKDNELVVACSGPRIRSVAGRHESSQVTRAKPTKAVETWVVVKFMGLFLDP